MKKNKIYRDIIYFNGDKIQSILAQLNEGLIHSMRESNSSKHDLKGDINTSPTLELLLPIKAKGGYNYIKTKELQTEKTLHDFALSELITTINFKDVSKLDRSSLNMNNERTFIKTKGKLSIYDYKELHNNLDKLEKLGVIVGQTSGNENISKIRDFIGNSFENMLVAEIKNSKDIGFTGLMDNAYMRDTSRSVIFKYGSLPKGDWEMISQITNVPVNSGDSINEVISSLFSDFPSSFDNIKSVNEITDKLIERFAKFHDVISSVNFPKIAVEPLAIYKEINL